MKKRDWEDYISSLTADTNVRELCKKIKIIAGTNNNQIPQALKINNQVVTKIYDICKGFTDHFEAVSSS